MPKQNFDQKLIKLLESNPDFVDDTGTLHRAAIRECAWKLDPDIIKQLITDKNFFSGYRFIRRKTKIYSEKPLMKHWSFCRQMQNRFKHVVCSSAIR